MPKHILATVRLHDLIATISARFEHAGLAFGHGTATAHDEACWLTAHVLGLDVTAPLPELTLDAAAQAAVEMVVQARLEQRQPLAYLLGEAWFCGLPWRVNQHTLVPRSPLAELIQERFHPWLDSTGYHTLLDIGTGCGCIAIACAVYMPWLQVIGSDIDRDALAVAADNARRHRVAQRCRWSRADVYAGLQQRFDIIISNPPYVPAAAAASMPPEYRHEPAHALYSGDDGLQHVAQILVQAHAYLNRDGALILELGETAALLQQQLPMLSWIWPHLETGGEGVIIATADMLQRHEHDIKHWYQQRQQGS